MYVYCGVRLDERNVRWVYDYNGDLCGMSRWSLVRWWCGPTRFLHVHGRILFWNWCHHGVRGHNFVVRDVYGRELVRRGRGPACGLYLLGWVLFACWCRGDVCGHVTVVHVVLGWQFMCG